MNTSRRNAVPPAVAIMPPLGERAKVATPRSISPTSRALNGVSSTPSDCATDWMAANWPMPAAEVGSRKTAARVTRGAISLSSSTHLPLIVYSKFVKPVALAPGRARERLTLTIFAAFLTRWRHPILRGVKKSAPSPSLPKSVVAEYRGALEPRRIPALRDNPVTR